MPLVPTYFTVIWDGECAAVAEWDGLDECGEEAGEDFIFLIFGVLECEGVMVVHHDGDVGEVAPDIEHRLVDDPG